MKNKKQVQMWVHPDFAKKLKIEAVTNNMKLIPYTKKLAVCEDMYGENEKKQKKRFNYSF